jgi:hypothetical protein
MILHKKIYIKARATPKVVAAFAESSEFDKILIYLITPECSRTMQLTQVQFCWEILRNTRKWEDDLQSKCHVPAAGEDANSGDAAGAAAAAASQGDYA